MIRERSKLSSLLMVKPDSMATLRNSFQILKIQALLHNPTTASSLRHSLRDFEHSLPKKHAQMFTAALFIIAITWRPSRCTSRGEWIDHGVLRKWDAKKWAVSHEKDKEKPYMHVTEKHQSKKVP